MRAIVSILVLFVVWIALTGSLDSQELIVGFLVASFIGVMFPSISGENARKWFEPKRYVYLFLYIFYFTWQMIKSNIDVAKRVINPKLPINPGIVKVETKLKSDIAKLALANSITLTPGTLTIDVYGQYFYIHWIDVKDTDVQKASEDIVKGFEKYLEVIFD